MNSNNRGSMKRSRGSRELLATLYLSSIVGTLTLGEKEAHADVPGFNYPFGVGFFFGPSSNDWKIRYSGTTGNDDLHFAYGTKTSTPLVGDWDGTGAQTIGNWDNGEFFLHNSISRGNAEIVFAYGLAGDTALAGDWDGDGITTIGVWRKGQWLLRNSNSAGNPDLTFVYGNSTDVPIVGDWDGNGTTTVGVIRNGNQWLLKNTNTHGAADISFTYGQAGDIPIPGDWDGDGTTTPGVVRPSGSPPLSQGPWLLRNSNTGGNPDISFEFDQQYAGTLKPIAGNWRRPWRPLVHQPASPLSHTHPDTALLLTDGTVMVHDGGVEVQGTWSRLTPDITGSYGNGTWSPLDTLPAGYGPTFFASAVLPDGRVIIEGGEYNFASQPVDTNLGAIFDPTRAAGSQWTNVAPPAGWTTIGDAPSTVLANGLFMLGNCCTKDEALFNAQTLTWTATGAGKNDKNSEEGFTLLPSTEVLAVDVGAQPSSELYNPFFQSWSLTGGTAVQLVDTKIGIGEIGPELLMNNGNVFVAGGFPAGLQSSGPAHTALYSYTTGVWTKGPDLPSTTDGFVSCDDAPAALLPNGKVLLAASPGVTFDSKGAAVWTAGTHFFEFDGSTVTEVARSPNSVNEASFGERFLLLPNGQVLVTDGSPDVELYQTSGVPSTVGAPTITSVPASVSRGSTYAIAGTQFNGLSQAVAYGDDVQGATNYPLVRITNNATHHVFYARTHGHSSMAVATGTAIVQTSFTVSFANETGASTLVVVANGIPSASVAVTVQ